MTVSMISNTDDIKTLTISDVHFGHGTNPTEDIVKNFDVFFDDYTSKSQFCDLDIIFIAGDLYDRLLDASSDEFHVAMLWLGRLSGFCKRFNIKLRILEGTPSHDWRQSKIACTLQDILKNDVDFKYIDNIEIEYLNDLQLHILYVPDEITGSAKETFRRVKVLMDSMGIEKVDIAIMHGMFHYQLPEGIGNVQKHNEDDYLNIVRHFINIGHIHTHSVYDRIIAQGSFDRLAHGEEEAKGAVMCIISKTNGNSFFFIENKRAKIYKTIVLKSKDLERSIKQIEKDLAKLPDNSHIRIKATKDHPLYMAFEDLKVRYPMFYFKKTSLEDEAEDYILVKELIVQDESYIPITIQKENIVEMLMTEVRNKYELPSHKLVSLQALLENTHGR